MGFGDRLMKFGDRVARRKAQARLREKGFSDGFNRIEEEGTLGFKEAELELGDEITQRKASRRLKDKGFSADEGKRSLNIRIAEINEQEERIQSEPPQRGDSQEIGR